MRKNSGRPKQAETLLALLNPARLPHIELEDMKSLVLCVPPEVRETVREILQEFVFSRRSFSMPPQDFLRMYHEKCRATANRSSFATRECTPAHSPAPDRSFDQAQNPLDTSYTELHEKRKQIRKQLNTRDLVTAVRLDSKLRKVRTPSLSVKQAGKVTRGVDHSARWKFVNAKDLLEIRRRHLSSQYSLIHYL